MGFFAKDNGKRIIHNYSGSRRFAQIFSQIFAERYKSARKSILHISFIMNTLNKEELKALETYLLKKIDAEHEVVIEDSEAAFSQFRQVLKDKIQEMLTYNLEGLMQILYRLDVPEEETDHAFEAHSVGSIAEKITESVIEREIKRYKLKREMGL